MNEKQHILVEKIKKAVIDFVHYSEEPMTIKFSNYLSELLEYDYNYLSNIFSEFQGNTIEQYIILQKIEKAKELLASERITLTDVAYKMGYSSVAHLSYQFKKATGMTPSEFIKTRNKRSGSSGNQ